MSTLEPRDFVGMPLRIAFAPIFTDVDWDGVWPLVTRKTRRHSWLISAIVDSGDIETIRARAITAHGIEAFTTEAP